MLSGCYRRPLGGILSVCENRISGCHLSLDQQSVEKQMREISMLDDSVRAAQSLN